MVITEALGHALVVEPYVDTVVVLNAPLATHVLIAARTDIGVSLLLTDFDAADPPAGVTAHRYRTIRPTSRSTARDYLRRPCLGKRNCHCCAPVTRAARRGVRSRGRTAQSDGRHG